MQNLSKLHEMIEIRYQNPISATEQKKWMEYRIIMIKKLFMDGMLAYLNCFFLLTLFPSFHWNIIFFNFLVLSFEAQ
jgi:hypothetical protein